VQVIRVYQVIPGVALTDSKYDDPSDTFILTTRTLKLTSSIVEALTLITGSGHPYTIQLVESEPYNNFLSWEKVTVCPAVFTN